jgi:hypothetical protein
MKTQQPEPDPYTDLGHVYANPEGNDASQEERKARKELEDRILLHLA